MISEMKIDIVNNKQMKKNKHSVKTLINSSSFCLNYNIKITVK